MSDEVEVIADTLGWSVEHSLLAFHDSALCLSVCPTKWLLGIEWRTDRRMGYIYFNSSDRLRLHHSSYLHVTYTLHVARENPIEGNILTPFRHSASQRRMVNVTIYQCCCRRCYSEV